MSQNVCDDDVDDDDAFDILKTLADVIGMVLEFTGAVEAGSALGGVLAFEVAYVFPRGTETCRECKLLLIRRKD